MLDSALSITPTPQPSPFSVGPVADRPFTRRLTFDVGYHVALFLASFVVRRKYNIPNTVFILPSAFSAMIQV